VSPLQIVLNWKCFFRFI